MIGRQMIWVQYSRPTDSFCAGVLNVRFRQSACEDLLKMKEGIFDMNNGACTFICCSDFEHSDLITAVSYHAGVDAYAFRWFVTESYT